MNTQRRSRPGTHDLSVYVLASLGILGLAVMCAMAFGRNNEALTGFHVPFRPAYVPAPDQLKDAEFGFASNSTLAAPRRSAAVKAIIIFPRHIELVRGGKRVVMLAGSEQGLSGIVKRIHRRAWIEQAGSVVTIDSALIAGPGATITIGGPKIKTVRLLAGASIGADSGRLTFDDVHVLSWTGDGRQIRTPSNKPRPSVLAENNAKMIIVHSIFSGLGWDWNGSYGVSWMNGATGRATGSTFERNFIGLYTGHVAGLDFDDDTFRANNLYGLDPHSDSKRLTITDDIAEDNTGHGIIFSDGVTDSTITRCTSRDNHENGIMMDAHSTGNTISNNEVYGNAGDGIVLSRSPDNRIVSNSIYRNRIGIHIAYGNATVHTVVLANNVSRNEVALQGVEIGPTNSVSSNGGQWEVRDLTVIGAGALILLTVITALILGLSRLPSGFSRRSPPGQDSLSDQPADEPAADCYP